MLKRLMGSPDNTAETASIIRISYTYQNDSLHLRKERFFFFLCSLYDSKSVLSPSSENCFAFWEVGAEVPGCLGRSRVPPSLVPHQLQHLRGMERWHSHSHLPFHKTKKDLDCKRSDSYIWAKSCKKCI